MLFQAIRKWLTLKEHGVHVEDKKVLMYAFMGIVYAQNDDEIIKAKQTMENLQSFKNNPLLKELVYYIFCLN